ncbi:MAG TPA: DUF3667 domain-containing protein [Pyrinomonadaceae bacterium]
MDAVAPPIQTCPNCSTSLLGSHCHECGQKKIDTDEYSLKRFIGRAISDFTDLESSKVFRTLAAMIARPGLLAVEYLAGRRGKYLGPLKLYLTFSALYFLFAWTVLADVRGGSAQRIAQMPPTISMAKRRGLDVNAFADKLHEKTEKYASGLRVFSVLISGTFLAALYFRQRKYYVEHLVFSLYYYSFDFFSKSFFALLYLVCAAIGFKLPVMVLNLFYPIAFVYLAFALRRVYQQKWVLTVVKAVVLFACETLLFIAVNIGGLAMAYVFA